MTEDFIFQSGYAGLFIISFLAATLIPLGSEMFVAIMTVSGYNLTSIFITAATANTLGAITNYYVGKLGTNFMLSRYIKIDPEKRKKTETIYKKWGTPILFFSWLPIIGDPLTVIAGAFRLNLPIFIFWVALGKSLRYIIVIKTAETILKNT